MINILRGLVVFAAVLSAAPAVSKAFENPRERNLSLPPVQELVPPTFDFENPSGYEPCGNELAFAYNNPNERSDTEVWRSRSADSGFEFVGLAPGGGFYDQGLESRKTYYYKLRARTINATSEFSEAVGFESGAKWFDPLLELFVLPDNTIQGKLTDRSYLDVAYEISSGTSPSGFFATTTLSDSGRVFTFIDTSAQPGQTYTYAVNGIWPMTCGGRGPSNTVNATITIPDASSFTLINADTDEDIRTINEGDVITLSPDTHYNIRYNATGSPGSVVFQHQGRVVRKENARPYSLAGDRSGDYFPWIAVEPGDHSVAATPYSEPNGDGRAGGTHTVNFHIVTGEGSSTFTLVNADTDEDIKTLQDGDVFVKPADMNINIRYNPAGTAVSVVFKHNDRTIRKENAAPFALAGDRSGDYMTWNGATPGEHTVEATPHDQLNGAGTSGESLVIHFRIDQADGESFAQSGQGFSQLSIYPNPANALETELKIGGFEGVRHPIVTDVKIIKLTGEIVFADVISCDGNCGSYLVQMNEPLAPGLYMVTMRMNGFQSSKRLIVR